MLLVASRAARPPWAPALRLAVRSGASILLAVICLTETGCLRSYYRRQADDEAYALVSEKANNPHWALQRTSIDIDPRSRMFDPFDPDHPPMPPDDPASHELMHCVDGTAGPFGCDHVDLIAQLPLSTWRAANANDVWSWVDATTSQEYALLGLNTGLAILDEADKLGCDLLFKGAYTQSRIRQMILGGATSQILASTALPVFMAN